MGSNSVADAFYGHFPSFREDEKRIKSRNEQKQDLIDYLEQAALKAPPSKRKSKRPAITTDDENYYISPSRILAPDNTNSNGNSLNNQENLKSPNNNDTTRLNNILNYEIIEERNRNAAEDAKRKSMEYLKELEKQIEEKRLKIQNLKEKNKEKEIQEHLNAKRHDEKLHQESRELIKLQKEYTISQHFPPSEIIPSRVPAAVVVVAGQHQTKPNKVGYNANTNTYRYDNRQTQSENGKDVIDPATQKHYNYFSNSAGCENNGRYRNENAGVMGATFKVEDHCRKCLAIFPTGWSKILGEDADLCMNCAKSCPLCNHHLEKESRSLSKDRNEYLPSIYSSANSSISPPRSPVARRRDIRQQRAPTFNRQSTDYSKDESSYDEVEYISPQVTHRRRVFNDRNSVNAQSTPSSNEAASKRHHSKRSEPDIPELDINLNDDESDTEVEILTKPIFDPIYVRNREPYSMALEDNSIFNPETKIPEPKIGVVIQNGKMYVDTHTENVVVPALRNHQKLKEKQDVKKKSEVIADRYLDFVSRRRSNVVPVSNSYDNGNVNPSRKSTNNIVNSQVTDGVTIRRKPPPVITQVGAIRKEIETLKEFGV